MAKKKAEGRKIFVLDTSVIIYDHNSIHQFKEHDVAIPITVLEELDNFKKGNDTKNFAAREFIRMIDGLAGGSTLQQWIPLDGKKAGSFKVVMTGHLGKEEVDANRVFGEVKADHRILNAALQVQREYPDRKVILVSKDINLRLKAKSLNVLSEDYETGKIKDVSTLYKGESTIGGIETSVINALYQDGTCSPGQIGLAEPQNNHYYILKEWQKIGLGSLQCRFRSVGAHREDRSIRYPSVECGTGFCIACHSQSKSEIGHAARRCRHWQDLVGVGRRFGTET
jgi:PhoH-like ATPase